MNRTNKDAVTLILESLECVKALFSEFAVKDSRYAFPLSRAELDASIKKLRDHLTQPAPPASQEQMSNGLTEAETNATASVMGLTASQEQAQQPSGGEVVAWTESKPKKPGVYGWRGSPASYDMVHVHTRPTEHSPGGQLNGSCLSGKGFYHGCAITSWGGEWIGPLDTLTLATPKPEPRRLGLVRDLLKHIEQNTCTHEETHRGGAIWEICNACGSMWADDKGGKPEFVWPDVVERAREYLAHHRITKGEA